MNTVVVVGGSLTGMAAAARLAKAGHRVLLVERAGVLGGRAATQLPEAIALPAAWRDLFKKSGRPLEAELARHRLALVTAPPAVHTFTDGATLVLPTDRGEQWARLAGSYSPGVAARWRDLLDGLDDTWQVLRRLGLEAEVDPGSIPRATLKALKPGVSIEHLARTVGHPHLAELIRAVAHGLGSDPRRTPGWCAARLSIERTFGRWLVTDSEGAPQPSARLVELLAERLATRGVELHLDTTATRITPGRVIADRGAWDADQIVVAIDPWTHDSLVGHTDPVIARAARRLRPAQEGRPVPWRALPSARRTATDPAAAHQEPHSGFGGPQWHGWRTLRSLPPLRTGLPGVVAASASSLGGPDPWARLLTGALVAYRVHADLTGEDIRPTNKALGERAGPADPNRARPRDGHARTVISTSTNRSEALDPE